jgi:sec-independent protein translocase protein TatB
MFDIGWTELVLVGIVALIVIGPEDLPDMFRQIGRFTAKIRAMSRDFSRAMEQAAKESGVKDVAKDLKTMTSPKSLGLNAMKDAADKFEKWDPLKKSAPAAKAATPAEVADKPAGDKPAGEAASSGLNHGPATRALYEKQAAKRAALLDKAAQARAAKEMPAVAKLASAEAAQAKTPAKTGAKSGAKPAPKPAAPKAAAPKAVAAKAVAPDAVAPKAAAPKAVAPKAVAAKTAPKNSDGVKTAAAPRSAHKITKKAEKA